MRSHSQLLLLSIIGLMSALSAFGVAQSQPPTSSDSPSDRQETDSIATQINKNAPDTVVEARGRARILHETLHGALQVMHRDFFREDEGLNIPSRSLEDVFSELATSYGVELQWIAVDLKAMNVDNEPSSDFEKEAVRVLKTGQDEFESIADNRYRFVGKIRLSAICLSCHASARSSNDTRAAGLVISMPLKKEVTTTDD
ncbi:MAG: DUF3365 domain-containing protein [Planctomycetaceae bacterium]